MALPPPLAVQVGSCLAQDGDGDPVRTPGLSEPEDAPLLSRSPRKAYSGTDPGCRVRRREEWLASREEEARSAAAVAFGRASRSSAAALVAASALVALGSEIGLLGGDDAAHAVVRPHSNATVDESGWCGVLRVWTKVNSVLVISCTVSMCVRTSVPSVVNMAAAFLFVLACSFWGFYGMWLLFSHLLSVIFGAVAGIVTAYNVCRRTDVSMRMSAVYSCGAAGVVIFCMDYFLTPADVGSEDALGCEKLLTNVRWICISFAFCIPIPILGVFVHGLYQVVQERMRALDHPTLDSIAPARKLSDADAVAQLRTEAYTEDCPICTDHFRPGDKVRLLQCKHAFHTSCVDPWFIENRHTTCPTCRVDIQLPRSAEYDWA
eukprot:TRINITY_DN896_c0_g1_i5.p1 TRINITY_DN896_c0_g1~~TRINITY_DN896_c0_g1_i5.p1  ORF type:complete len:377 (+),score=47.32 TRINITY_DN896_c0_g1_i5:61-1191(+)